MEGDAEAFDLLFEQAAHRLDRHVATGQAGAAGRDDDIDVLALRAIAATCARIALMSSLTMRAVAELMAGGGDRSDEHLAGLVGREVARVGHGQHRDTHAE